MKVVILGCGGVGSVLAKLLSKEKEIEEIICADVKFNFKFQNKKISLKYLDILKKNTLFNFLKKFHPDIVINAALPEFNLKIMGECCKSRVNYLDTASYWDFDKNPRAKVPYKMEQLDFDEKFKKAEITGLINAGVSPGLTNLIAKECADNFDKVDFIKIRLFEDTASNELFFSWNKDWLLDEISFKPLVYYNHKFKIMDNFEGEEEYNFPKPIGKKKVYYFCQDEVGSLPLFIKTKNVDVKAYDNNIEISKLLVKLGLVSRTEIKFEKNKLKPITFLSKILPNSPSGIEKKFKNSFFAVSIEVTGKSNKKKKLIKYSVIFPKQNEINKMNLGANFISYPTAFSIKIFVMNFFKIRRRGVFPIEAIEKEARKDMIRDLEKSKINILKMSK